MLGTYALSAGYYDAYYLKALKVRTLIKGDFDAAFQTVDALVAPTSPTVAFAFGARMDDPVAMYLSDACTLPVNVAGLPGLSVPCGLSEGLPVGLQFIGKPFDELTLFRLGRAYEAITADAAWRGIEPTDLARLDDPATQPPGGARTSVGVTTDRMQQGGVPMWDPAFVHGRGRRTGHASCAVDSEQRVGRHLVRGGAVMVTGWLYALSVTVMVRSRPDDASTTWADRESMNLVALSTRMSTGMGAAAAALGAGEPVGQHRADRAVERRGRHLEVQLGARACRAGDVALVGQGRARLRDGVLDLGRHVRLTRRRRRGQRRDHVADGDGVPQVGSRCARQGELDVRRCHRWGRSGRR